MDYYVLLEKLIRALVDKVVPDKADVAAVLGDLCKLFRVSKWVTYFYESVAHEKRNKGEEVVLFDDGKSGDVVYTERVLADTQAVVICRVYLTKGAEPLSEEEQERVLLIQRVLLSITSRNRLQQVVEKLSFYDGDEYPNLRFMFRQVERMDRDGILAGKIAVHFNLTHFALVNQQVGRPAGNMVMRNFFKTVCGAVGEDGVVCRIGGDNFALLCTEEKLSDVLNVLRGTPLVYDVNTEERVMVAAAAGVFRIPAGFVYNNNGDIMDKIMSASQQARNGGGDTVVYYDENMVHDREKVMKVQRLFVEALQKEEFKVFYQPKVSVITGELSGSEALCRWFHDGKVVPPMDFIPILEQNTDICKLDFYMLDHVCRDIRRWLDEGKQVVRTSVNLSRKHMMDFELKEHILEIIDKNRVPHEYIEVELTETTTDVEFKDLKRVVNGLQEAGISTSVDDFGMGYSSLNLLREIPWNVLKVDKSFLPIDDDDESSTRSIMFRYVVAMARELGLECIAEGVETRKQVDILKDNSCDLAQGYYFDKPLPKEEYEGRLMRHKYEVTE